MIFLPLFVFAFSFDETLVKLIDLSFESFFAIFRECFPLVHFFLLGQFAQSGIVCIYK